MNINLKSIPFSMARSYMAISDLDQDYRGGGNREGLHLRTVRGGAVSSIIGRLTPLFDSSEISYTYEASADELVIRAEEGELRICYADERTILVKGLGKKIGMRLDLVRAMPFFHFLYEVSCRDNVRYLVNCFGQNVKYLVWTQSGSTSMNQVWEGCTAKDNFLEFKDTEGELLAVIREVSSEWDGVYQRYDYEVSLTETKRKFEYFAKKMPEVPKRYRETALAAAYVNWASIVAGEGFLPRDTMYMSKNWMCNIWAWDHCFNAIALAYKNPSAAWDQWMIPFDLQDPTGLIPDTTNNSRLDWNYCKPPVHGWALSRMMQVMKLKEDQMAEAYDKLEKWTNWWLNYRDHDNDGICEYTHGFDSGWDNATAFCEMPPVELPDLQTFLILQMETLADLAERLGRAASAEAWKTRSESMLTAMLEHCFENGCPKAVRSGSHKVIETQSLILYMPVLLGERLPEHIRINLVDTLKSGGFLTTYGFATENLASLLYDPDGYWRGPIWAPSTLLLLDGLYACGEKELVRTVSEAFCNMVKEHGFAENFNAVTGKGLRDLAYTWTPSVFLTIAYDYLGEEEMK